MNNDFPKIRMGMVGGGVDALIGPVHRLAARLTGSIELVCGSFGATRQKSYDTGKALGLDAARVYGTYREMMKKESRLPEDLRMHFVSIVTPTNMHYPVTMAAIDAGFHVLSEKPMSTSMDEALNLRRKLQDCGLAFGVMHTHAGFPMLAEARDRIANGDIGEVRKVWVAAPQGWLATRLETAGHKQAGWRMDPRRAGLGGCLADIGSTAAFLVEYVSGRTITEVCADLHTFIPGRPVDDDASILFRCGREVRGAMTLSLVAAGETGGLTLSVYGSKGGLVWRETEANVLCLNRLSGERETLGRTTGNLSGDARALMWLPPGFGEGFLEACANVYRGFAQRLAWHIQTPRGTAGAPPAMAPCSDIDAGVRVIRFLDAVMRHHRDEELARWMPVAPLSSMAPDGPLVPPDAP